MELRENKENVCGNLEGLFSEVTVVLKQCKETYEELVEVKDL